MLKEFPGNLVVLIIYSPVRGFKKDLMYVILLHNIIFSKKKSKVSHWGRFSHLWKNKIKIEDWKPKVGEDMALVAQT